MSTQVVFLVSLTIGILALVGAIGIARWNWRNDVPPFGLTTRVSDVMLHPNHYALARAIPAIRLLTIVGSLSLIIAIVAAVGQIAALLQ